MTQYIINKHIPTTITSKGQITLPAEVRKHLGVDTSDKVDFVITARGQVYIDVPKYQRIADLAGAAGKLASPPSEQQLEQIAAEAIADAAASEGS